ncbi:iron complex outermembrane receptor protein [Sphingomonas kyeonggiensis]|uniref:Iron complex outermembrane receptor protein n=1 Tax=Sphingomonas kyeonggiensis TaxID=1268553 RepID=A0A7W7NTW4_9SPHN|nr:TonB-dependent receptor [Sphingomonas kyeonggiensis]MBB4840331.1 iron complex outermembrane receptor protein [Sphingomonas kyeonggiensis]
MNLRLKFLVGTALTCAAVPAYAQDSVPSRDDGEIVVTGIRKSLQDAIETKKRANSIVDVISAEDVGKLADSNVAESLSRLPGVTVDHQFGEGEQLSIAGVEPALNRLTIDGHSVASADWGGNPSDRSSRSFNYSLLSPTIISQAVVYKTPEARLQEGAIGASVDIVTRKPLDLKPNTVALTGGGEYNSRAKRGSFRGSALYSWHNADETIGFLGAVNYDKEQLSRAGSAVYWYRTGDALLDRYPKDANGNIIYGADGRVTSGPTLNGQLPNAAMIAEFSKARVASFLAREFFKQERERIGFSGAIQVRPADNLTLTGTALVIRGNYDNLSNSEYTYGYEGSLLQSATYADGMVTSATFAGITSGNGATGQLDTNFRRTRVKNDSLTLMFDWKPGDWVVTGNFGGTRASGGKDPEYLLDFRTKQGFTSGTNGQSTYVNWQYPASDASRWLSNYTALGGENQTEAAVRAANGGNPFFGRQIGGITYAEKTRDNELFGQADVSRKVNLGPITEILFGARFASHTNSNTTVGGATFTNQNFTLADLNPYVLDSNLYDGLGVSGNGTPYATLDADAIRATLEKYGNISVSRGLSKDQYFHVKETIVSGYLQANFEAGRFRGNVGGRYVFTRDQSQFYVQSGGVFAPTQVNTDDNRFLPAANLIFQAGENVVLRASAAKVMARARYSDLAGSLSLDDTTRSGSGGNPDLKPYAATNFGLSAEWYFAPASYISGEVFYRDVSNYIGNAVQDGVSLTNTVTGRTLEYSISRPVNGGKAKVTGFSLTANANLFWGFGIQSNYTFTDADTGSPTGLPFLSRDTFTLVPYFEKGPFQARVSFNRRSKYFYRFGRQQSQDYTDGYSQLDASISYNLTDKLQVSASASNLLDETYYQYSSDPKFPTSVYKNGRVYSLSASFRM